MSDIFSAGAQVAGAAIQANAVKDATQMQISALQQQRQFVFDNLNPSTVNAQATAADIQQAMSDLALQGQVDPALLQARYQSESNVLNQGQTLGQQSGQVMDAATQQALAGTPGMTDAKNQMVDAALAQLKAGATLPPDVENQLVQAGLEQSGMVTQNAQGRGLGGQMLRTVLGTAGIQLQQQRQQQAANLLTSAQNLSTQQQNILQSLFPRLAQTQLSNLQGQQSVLQQANSMMPNVGLNGSNIANIWLARVGATNQLTQSAANAAAQGQMASGNIWGNALGGASGSLAGMAPSGWTSAGLINSLGSSGAGAGTYDLASSGMASQGAQDALASMAY